MILNKKLFLILTVLLPMLALCSFTANAKKAKSYSSKIHKSQCDKTHVLDFAKQIIVMEAESGQVLYEKNADEKMMPSSMIKILTIIPVFQRLQDGRLKLGDTLSVSVEAWRSHGKEESRMFLEPNTAVTIEDLLRGIIVQSGNDACTVVAEGLGGTEEQYAQELTDLAQNLGASNTVVKNASGMPHEDQYTTAKDLAIIARTIITKYPEYYPLFKEVDFTYNNIRQGNRNPLLYKEGLGVDGLKTGSTDAGGFGMVTSAEKDGMRLIIVINGTKNVNERSRVGEYLVRWGFREFKRHKVFVKGQTVDTANVWLGKKSTVPLIASKDISLLLPHSAKAELKAQITYHGPIAAPIKQGQEAGTLTVTGVNILPITIPLIVGEDVEEVGPMARISSALRYILLGAN